MQAYVCLSPWCQILGCATLDVAAGKQLKEQVQAWKFRLQRQHLLVSYVRPFFSKPLRYLRLC